MTSPQIGNYGTNLDDEESKGPKVTGFVVRDLSPVTSNWRSTDSLSDYLQKNGIPGIEGVDTRAITKKLRTAGSLKACLSTEGLSDEEAVKKAQQSESIVGQDYVKEVTCSESFVFDADGEQSIPFTVTGTNLQQASMPDETHRLVAFDFGAKKRFIKISEDTALRLSSCLPRPPLRRLNLILLMPFSFQMDRATRPHSNTLIKRSASF